MEIIENICKECEERPHIISKDVPMHEQCPSFLMCYRRDFEDTKASFFIMILGIFIAILTMVLILLKI